jgi:hypothetical protein
MKSIEHAEQVALMKWWALVHNRYNLPEQLLFAIPNGGQRNLIVATKLKAEGVRAGIPDLFLAVPRGRFHGMFVEMKKTKGGRVPKNQQIMLETLNLCGYYSIVCHGWNEARDAITQYLTGDMDYGNS